MARRLCFAAMSATLRRARVTAAARRGDPRPLACSDLRRAAREEDKETAADRIAVCSLEESSRRPF